MPALTGLDDEGGTREDHQRHDEAGSLAPEQGSHDYSHQRMPAPIDRAMIASSVNAQVKRARFAFTTFSLPMKERRSDVGNRAVSVRSLVLRPRLATGLPWTTVSNEATHAAREER